MKWIPLLALAFVLPGCLGDVEPADLAVASYPAAFAAESLAGDDLTVADLGTGTGLHDFEPSTRQLEQLRKSDHLVLWSEGLESWAHQAEESLGASAPDVIELIRPPPGMAYLAPEEGGDHGDEQDDHEEAGHDDHGHDALDHDPHTWTDPLAMQASAHALADELTAAYPEHADNLTARLAALDDRLESLHEAFVTGLQECTQDTIVVNHEAYRYMGARYNFTIISLHGLEPGSEPSPDTVQEAIETIRDLGLRAIFIEEGTDPDALRAIQDETGVRVEVLETLETRPADGDYVDAQYKNIDALRYALECP